MRDSREEVNEFKQALLALDRLGARNLVMAAGVENPLQRIERLVVPALEQIGLEWEQGRVALSQIYMSGRICEELVDNILPPGDPHRKNQPKTAIATLADHHLLGKRIVYSALRASGFGLVDFGRVEVDDLVRRVKDEEVKIILLSVLMLPSALKVREVRDKVNQTNGEVKIVVGGAPFRFDDQLWQEVGADAMGRNASDAVDIITRITGDIT
jgi:methanogenic corrinoid protein MtbC1